MEHFATILLVLHVMILQSAHAQIFNVLKYGARGDGATDDSKAFSQAWAAVCTYASGSPILQIPAGRKFLLKPVAFNGPCKSSAIYVKLQGTLIAPSNPSAWSGYDNGYWLRFYQVNGLTLEGNGQIDGQGYVWWKLCGKPKNCPRPTALAFIGTNNLKVNGLTHLNSQRNHISIVGSNGVVLSNLHISAPETSPNTDGIDISTSQNVQIIGCNISTGDDCVAINTGSSYINITGMNCGPGHGISVGSLGLGGDRDTVEEVHVKSCTFKGAMNGARIKTWQGGLGYAKKISFDDITLMETQNPIIIDQFYNPGPIPSKLAGPISTDDLSISGISFTGFHGTSATPSAITLKCSHRGGGCTGITIAHINITSSNGEMIYSTCQNARGTNYDSNPKVDCLLKGSSGSL